MRYDFECDECGERRSIDARAFHPPIDPQCNRCGKIMDRIFGCEMDTSNCRDHDDIPAQARVTQASSFGHSKLEGERREAAYAADIAAKRAANRGMRNSTRFRMTHSIPTELYHGKIKETGDRGYWQDKKNVAKHNSCKIG